MTRRRALFLDRDGTINVDAGYVGTRDRFEWIPGAREAIAAATASGWLVFVVTNQSGVARGLFSEADMDDLHAWMVCQIRAAGGQVAAVRACPHHPEAPLAAYRRICPCRKPAPGMILDLMAAWQLAPEDCILIGDQDRDLAAAAAASIAARRFAGGDLRDVVLPLLRDERRF